MARFRPGDVPVLVEEHDHQNNQTLRWHCEPPAPGAWYVVTRGDWFSPAPMAQATYDIYEWRPAWQRPG